MNSCSNQLYLEGHCTKCDKVGRPIAGDVLLRVERLPPGWRWAALAWLAAPLSSSDVDYPTREEAKVAA